MRMKSTYRSLVSAGLTAMLPNAAHACSACILADPKTSGTYLKMTLVMSALPLSLLGGISYWLWRRYSPRRKPSAVPSHPVQISASDGVLEGRGA